MPYDRSRYPPDWDHRRAADLARVSYRCQGTPRYPECRAVHGEPHPVTGSRVVLTRGHLNHDASDDRPENIRVWCQRCHLTFDAAHHAETARQTREHRSGQERLEL
jgi:hypothetical protein